MKTLQVSKDKTARVNVPQHGMEIKSSDGPNLVKRATESYGKLHEA